MTIEGLDKLNDMDVDTILAYAESDMNIEKASKKLYCHRNTVISHLIKVWEKTNLNPKRFYDLVVLVGAVNGLT